MFNNWQRAVLPSILFLSCLMLLSSCGERTLSPVPEPESPPIDIRISLEPLNPIVGFPTRVMLIVLSGFPIREIELGLAKTS